MKQLKVKLSWLKAVEALTDAEVGRLTRGALGYASSGEAPVFSGNERMIWPVVREDLDRQRCAFDRQSNVNKRNVTNRNESLQIVTNRNESLKRESTPPTTPGKETPVPLKKTSPKGESKESTLSPALQDTLKAFRDMRNRMRKPMTAYAVELLVQKLQKLSPDEAGQVAILKQSIENGWTGVYPVKQETARNKTRNTMLNYQEQGVSHANLDDIELDLEEL